jgi:hypothetical protein
MLLGILLQTLWVVSVLAVPANFKPTRSIVKRASPQIGDGYTSEQSTQITDGFKDALRIAKAVQTAPASTVDPILAKYFDPSDKETVTG